jgi:hypothetical protein
MQRPGSTKRQKERARREKQVEKSARRAERRREDKPRPDAAPGEDPDLVGIVPGPQAPATVDE